MADNNENLVENSLSAEINRENEEKLKKIEFPPRELSDADLKEMEKWDSFVLSSGANSPSGGGGEKLHFVKNFEHIFPHIEQQVRAGLYVNKRVAFYLQKIVTLQAEMLKGAIMATQHEAEKLKGIEQDQMVHFRLASISVQSLVKEMLKKTQDWATHVDEKVVVPLTQWHTLADAKRKKLVSDEEAAANNVQDKMKKMTSQRKECLKAWEELISDNEKADKEAVKAGQKEKPPAAVKKIQKKKEDVKKTFKKMEETRDVAAKEYERYRSVILPTLLQSMEAIETERLAVLQKALQEFTHIVTEYAQPIELTRTLENQVKHLDPEQSMQSLLLRWRAQYGDPVEYIRPANDLPCNPNDLDSDKWLAVANGDEEDDDDEEDEGGEDEKEDHSSDHKEKSGGGGEKEKQKGGFFDRLRATVSKKKRRFQEDGFDLDLSYINDNIIAMGIPSEGVGGMYRNNMKDVQRFLEKRHENHYRLYNLCAESNGHYNIDKFHGRVALFPFDDHHPCPVNMIDSFCKDVHSWLNADPKNVAVIHCKAGKGRTGFMIACYLVYSNQFPTPDAALHHFAIKRTQNGKGVTIPSQMRYVQYFHRFLKEGVVTSPALSPSTEAIKYVIPERRPLTIRTVVIHGSPYNVNASDIWLVIRGPERPEQYSSKGKITGERRVAPDYFIFSAPDPTGIAHVDVDTRLDFCTYGKGGMGKSLLFTVWFNTRLIDPLPDKPGHYRLLFPKSQIDKAVKKDKKHIMYPEGMTIEVLFTDQSQVVTLSLPPTSTASSASLASSASTNSASSTTSSSAVTPRESAGGVTSTPSPVSSTSSGGSGHFGSASLSSHHHPSTATSASAGGGGGGTHSGAHGGHSQPNTPSHSAAAAAAGGGSINHNKPSMRAAPPSLTSGGGGTLTGNLRPLSPPVARPSSPPPIIPAKPAGAMSPPTSPTKARPVVDRPSSHIEM